VSSLSDQYDAATAPLAGDVAPRPPCLDPPAAAAI